jgi:hypothetical protein
MTLTQSWNVKPFSLFAIGLVSAGPLVAQAPTRTNADVPVKKVVLFSSGVGYFEHAGAVRGNGTTELRFKTSQINDILKSIVLQDQDGGRVGAISYPSQDPLAKTLRSFQVDITQNPSLADLLNQLRGARVTIAAQAERHSGTILGVESRVKGGDKGETIVPVLNLLTGAMIRSIELPSISNLSLDDPQLQEELTRALSALVQARDQDKKPVTINFTGSGDRRVRIGYVVETPVWKTSYRLLLDDKSAHGRIQGWAIVENQTESDWNDVALSLVSGRPISFTMDLYQPLYATRPVVAQEMYASLRPQLYEDGIRDSIRLRGLSGGVPGSAQGQAGRQGQAAGGRGSAMALQEVVVTSATSGPMDMTSSVAAMAAASKMGELFQYTVPDVTLARQKSAMLPIITDSVELERMSIYNASVLATRPLNGVRIKNTTGKHLLQGPVTVLDGAGYAGDSRIDNLPPGQERLLSYGIDLDVLVDNTKNRDWASVLTAKIERGILRIQRKLVHSIDYVAENKSTKDRTLVIEHPMRQGWKLVDSPKPLETTPTLYRFKNAAPAKTATTLTVKEELVSYDGVAIANVDAQQLLVYSRTTEIPKPVRDALARAAELKQAVTVAEGQMTVRSQQISEITAEQNRIRENMKTVAPSTQYYERLLAKLNEQESSIERLQKERDTFASQRDAARRQLDDYLRDLVLE